MTYNSQKTYDYKLGSFFVNDEAVSLDNNEQRIVDDFHNLYFKHLERKSGLQISWMGVQTGKIPGDLWIYQEMMSKLKPDFVVECGTHHGGSAFFLANICQMLDHGRVLTIDPYPKPNRPSHKLLQYVEGSSTDPTIVQRVHETVGAAKNVLVLLDSNHTKEHVLQEINSYKDLVPVGGYLVVEDSFLNGNPSHEDFGAGPMEAIADFIGNNKNFIIDKGMERFLFTLNRNGFLKRTK